MTQIHPYPMVPHSQLKTIFDSENTVYTVSLLGFDEPAVRANKLAQLNIIRALPVTITQKKHIRAELASVYNAHTKGYGLMLWKIRQQQLWAKMRMASRETAEKLELWQAHFKEIDGHFGPGVVSYFTFLKTLFKMNTFIAFLWIVFIVLPGGIPSTTSLTSSGNSTNAPSSPDSCKYINISTTELSEKCTMNYIMYTVNNTAKVTSNHEEVLSYISDFIDGSGWMEYTVLFQGSYRSETLTIPFLTGLLPTISTYNLPLAYVLITGVYMLASLFILAIGSASTIRENMRKSTTTPNKYSDLVFSSWSFGLTSSSSAFLKQKTIRRDAIALLAEKRDNERRRNYTSAQKCRIYLIRVVVNILVIGLLAAGAYLIVYITEISALYKTDFTGFLKLLISYAPSLTLTVLNMLLPNIFEKFSRVEDFKPSTTLKLALIRSVFVRLAGLAFLAFTLYSQVNCSTTKDACNVHNDANATSCPQLYCWETYFGQNLYKLVLMQFFVLVGVTLLVDFPRKLIATRCGCKLAKMIGAPEFNISANVLELVYLQTICWFGAFFSPLIPAMVFLLLLIQFYMKKLTLLMNYKPNEDSYRSSDANTFFVVLLLISYLLSMLPLSYIIIKFEPSSGCGPFRVYDVMYDVVRITMCTWPDVVLTVFGYITSANFVVPLLFGMCVAIYYQSAVASVHKERASELTNQLRMETEEKKSWTRLNRPVIHAKVFQHADDPNKIDVNSVEETVA